MFEDLWQRINAEAQAMKFSQKAFDDLVSLYRQLDSADRGVVDVVLTDWVNDPDPMRRYDALGLIDEFKIRSALPKLLQAREELRAASGPSAPWDREKVDRTIATLEA